MEEDGRYRAQAVLCTGHWAAQLRRHGAERGSKQIVVSCSGLSGNKCSPILTLLCININNVW